jgi:hypothetical protein
MTIKMITCQNNGIVAVMISDDFKRLNTLEPHPCGGVHLEAAKAQGIKWFLFAKTERLLRNGNESLASVVTGNYETLEGLKEVAEVEEKSFHVPFSNGPQHWEKELKVVPTGTINELLARIRTQRKVR